MHTRIRHPRVVARASLLAAVIGLTVVAAPAAHAEQPSSPTIAMSGCSERWVFGAGDPDAVRRSVPASYALETDPAGRPLLLVNAIHCDAVALDGDSRSAPATFTLVAPDVQSPDGQGCESQAPVLGAAKGDVPPICNLYLSEWFTDSRDLARWADTGLPAGGPATYVPNGLVFDQQPTDPITGSGLFTLQTPDVSWHADVRPLVTPPLSLHIGVWWDSPDGGRRMKIALDPQDDPNQGQVDGRVVARPGSLAARLFGGNELTPLAGPVPAGLAPRWSSMVSRQVTKVAPSESSGSGSTGSSSAWCEFDVKGTAGNTGASPVGVTPPVTTPVDGLLAQPQHNAYHLQGPVHCTGTIAGHDYADGIGGTMTADGEDPADPLATGPNDTYNSCAATRAPFDVHIALDPSSATGKQNDQLDLRGKLVMQTAVFDIVLQGDLGGAHLLGRAGLGADPDGTEGECLPSSPYQEWAVAGEFALTDLASPTAPPPGPALAPPSLQGVPVPIVQFHYIGGGSLVNGPDAPPPNLAVTTPGLVVPRGEPITFANLDTHPHTVTSCSQSDCDTGPVAASVPGEGTVVGRQTNYCLQPGCADGRFDSEASLEHPGGTFTVDTSTLAPGTYHFFCEFHRWMRGSFTIVD